MTSDDDAETELEATESVGDACRPVSADPTSAAVLYRPRPSTSPSVANELKVSRIARRWRRVDASRSGVTSNEAGLR